MERIRALAISAGGLLYTAMQFGTALSLSAVTAVNVAALGDGVSPEAELDALRIALIVPVVAGVLGWGHHRVRPARPWGTWIADPVPVDTSA